MKTISTSKSHGGTQGVYLHASKTCACDMTFAVFVPPRVTDKKGRSDHGAVRTL
jgi:S-formylglutathione hydrolase